MARPHKTGLDYFSHDCDLSNDEKIESIEALYQNDGYAMFLKLLERIYRNGGELDISAAETQQILCQKCGINPPEKFQKMLLSMVNLKLFDKNAFESHKILTSSGIKKRCEYIVNKRVKEQYRYKEKVSAVETPPETGESKVKESKVKKRKEKNIYTPKTKHLDAVLLSQDEFLKLEKYFGMEGAREWIEKLNEGIMAKGYKYKSHYHAILSWDRRDKKTTSSRPPVNRKADGLTPEQMRIAH